MLKKRLVPKQLIRRTEKPAVVLLPPEKPKRFRSFEVFLAIMNIWWVWSAPHFLRGLFGKWASNHAVKRTSEIFEQMGGLWVKVGQLLAMRRDLFSDEFCDELSKLQDRARGFPGEIALGILEESMGCPADYAFDDFDPVPLAAASIGQVHRAVLRRTGAQVVIKVQRPYIQESFGRDLKYARALVNLMIFFKVFPHARWAEGLWELERTLKDELDYEKEHFWLRRMRKVLRAHKVYVPKVFSEFCTSRTLVMEFVSGVPMSDYIHMATTNPDGLKDWLEKNNIRPKRLGRQLYFSHARQIFEDNLFHCDLHPGNILLLRDSKFALIDFGAVGVLEESMLNKYNMLVQAIAKGNYNKVTDLFLLIGPPLPFGRDIESLRQDVTRMLREWAMRTEIKTLPYHKKSMTNVMGELARLFTAYKLPSTWEFMRINRAALTLDASLMFLLPDMNYIKLVKTYSDGRRQRTISKNLSADALMSQLGEIASLSSLPATLAENLYFNGETLRKRAVTFEATITKAAYAAKLIFSTLARFSLVGAAALLVGYFANRGQFTTRYDWVNDLLTSLPAFKPTTWGPLLVLAFVLYQFFSRLETKAAQKDPNIPGWRK